MFTSGSESSQTLSLVAGILAAAAAWFTPTLATVAMIIAFWMFAAPALQSEPTFTVL